MAWRARFREVVRDSGLTQREVAQRCGLAPETVSRILTGANAHPTFATIIRLARALRVSVGWLLDEPAPLGGSCSRRRSVKPSSRPA